jgi:glycosyltransferase involved in cell wall biosynthesis
VKSSGKLRIGVVSSFMPPHLGGLEVAAETIFNAYVAAGHEVRWVASHTPKSLPTREGLRVRVGCWNGLEEWFGVPWPIWGPKGIREIAQLVQWADVLHIHDCLYLSSAMTLLFARRQRKPVLLSQHIGFVPYRSSFLRGPEYIAYHTLGRAVLLRCSHVVFCTPSAEQFVTGWLGRRLPNVSSVPYGIDTARFRPPTSAERVAARISLGIPEPARVVLFTGRLVEKKGVELFLEVARRMSSLQFVMIGNGPLRPAPTKNLIWIPFVPPERMEIVYRAADIFLLPSHGEGFPLSVLEALATGLPVIASKGEPFTQRLERESACLSSERSPDGLCQAVDRLVVDTQFTRALAARARELAVREWSLELMGARYLALICALAQQN